MKKITKRQAQAEGYTIDNHASIGYKGARFGNPVTVPVYTDLECELLTRIRGLYANGGEPSPESCRAIIDELAPGFKP